jgi:hypothetical protein
MCNIHSAVLFGTYNRYWSDKHNDLMVPKLDNVLLPLGFELQNHKPVASRSTDDAILAAQYTRT